MVYALLKNPAYTRVSFQDSGALAVSELTIQAKNINAHEIRLAEIGGVPYVLFNCENRLSQNEICMLSRLSFVYAIFELCPVSNDCEYNFKPVALNANYFIDAELSGILKYTGKTNELFTRLMLNLAQFYLNPSPTAGKGTTLNILDPLAGKGTTLYEALAQGHNAYGVEVDDKFVHESVVYMKKYLETAKYKHENHAERIGGQSPEGKFTAQRSKITIARTKEEQKNSRVFEIIAGDTRNTSAFYKKNFFNAIIADLPYGVQHGSKADTKKTKPKSITRNAFGLISDAMPGWVRVLKPGGVIVLSWNLFLITREEMEELLIQNGFVLPETGVDFSHRVDQAIDRDLIIGVLHD